MGKSHIHRFSVSVVLQDLKFRNHAHGHATGNFHVAPPQEGFGDDSDEDDLDSDDDSDS